MSRKNLIAGISLLTIAGVILYLRHRRRTNLINDIKAQQVSEHGYETAHDILFPRNRISRRNKFGPTLPS
jgi:GTP cyclohydrolase II